MGKFTPKYLGKSKKYKHIYEYRRPCGNTQYEGKVGTYKRRFFDERIAAKWVDMRLIEASKQPVNILKPL